MTDWYEAVNSTELQQGDIIYNFPTIHPLFSGPKPEEIELDVRVKNVVILTQSCDLENGKVDSVLLCPVYSLEECMKVDNVLASKDGREQLRRGYFHAQHLLDEIQIAEHPELSTSFLVAYFNETVSQPFDYVLDFVKTLRERPRLRSPYREHLSQAYARFFMRVGLPTNIDPQRIKSLLIS